eukprot:TRINITY_DN12311_c0_g1_i9.p1 TRINITY_DN12311_c0_g1~~TRINITY_DN12311_c0_g1_i9.p1  ORF type:complete len:119 (+),score=12.18 TRINITY_DN12311_c0_g1_i9:434-790(+)
MEKQLKEDALDAFDYALHGDFDKLKAIMEPATLHRRNRLLSKALDANGDTALHGAVKNNHLEVVRYLITDCWAHVCAKGMVGTMKFQSRKLNCKCFRAFPSFMPYVGVLVVVSILAIE